MDRREGGKQGKGLTFQKTIPKFLQQYSHMLSAAHKKNYMEEEIGYQSRDEDDEYLAAKAVSAKKKPTVDATVSASERKGDSFTSHPRDNPEQLIAATQQISNKSEIAEVDDGDFKPVFRRKSDKSDRSDSKASVGASISDTANSSSSTSKAASAPSSQKASDQLPSDSSQGPSQKKARLDTMTNNKVVTGAPVIGKNTTSKKTSMLSFADDES